MLSLYAKVMAFKVKYPLTIGWRANAHCKVIERHLDNDEKVLYAFTAQKSNSTFNWITSCVVALTDRRLVIGQKRVLFGYFFYSITPDMFNDMEIKMGLIWGKVIIDTIKELVILSNISRRAVIEIEKNVTEVMMEEKQKYPRRPNVIEQ